MSFDTLDLDSALLRAVAEQGFVRPTTIQQQVIPAAMDGRDILASAPTGTGKTAAFLLPTMQHLLDFPRRRAGSARVLILTPTRELALQITEHARALAVHTHLIIETIIGGVEHDKQLPALTETTDIIVATPGRLMEYIEAESFDSRAIEILILDEADRMLDMGFIHDVKKILALLPQTKQSLLFSATFSDEIRELAGGLLKNPQSIQVTPRNTTVQRISQIIHPVGRGKKKQVLLHIIQQHDWSQVLVFTRTKFGANNVADYLTKNGVMAMALHGNKSQSARTQALEGFKTGQIRALVATDIAARGIDIDDLPHVVNYEIPNVSEDYVHRIGRTGRAGREGQAVSLVCMDEEGFMMEIERFTKQEIPVQVIDGFGPEEGEKAEPIAMGRQTIWGGAGKPPSRDVMQAAAKAARSDMMERIRSNKAGQGTPRGGRQQGGQGSDQRAGNGQGGAGRGGNAAGAGRPAGPRGQRPAHDGAIGRGRAGSNANGGNSGSGGNRRSDDSQPRSENAHLGTQLKHVNLDPRHGASGRASQPDPMRTSVDSMADRGRRGGFRSGGGGGGRGSRGGGFGR